MGILPALLSITPSSAGLLAAVLSATLSSAKDLVSKRLAFRLHGTLSTFASFACALPYYVVVLALLWLLGDETFTWSLPFLVMVFLRSVTDTMAEWLKMHAFAHADLSLVACFFSLSPLFLLITSPLITGDPLSVPGALAVVLVVVGSLLLVYRPSAHGWAEQKTGILLACGAAVFFSLNSCFDRLAVRHGAPALTGVMTPAVAGFTMTLLSALFLLPLVLRANGAWQALRAQQTGLWGRGALEVAFMVCKLYALQFLSAPDVVGVQRLSLLLSILGGQVFFREQDIGRRLAAAGLILGGVFLIAWL
jgi:drug/metabolite transporter (DMT)-like permease